MQWEQGNNWRMLQHRLLDSVQILQKFRFCFYCLEIFEDTTAYVTDIKWAVVFLIFTFCFCLNLSQFSCCCNVLIPRKWCKRKQPCFPVLCHTQISYTAANFKAKEGRKRDRKVSSIANTGRKRKASHEKTSDFSRCAWSQCGINIS